MVQQLHRHLHRSAVTHEIRAGRCAAQVKEQLQARIMAGVRQSTPRLLDVMKDSEREIRLRQDQNDLKNLTNAMKEMDTI